MGSDSDEDPSGLTRRLRFLRRLCARTPCLAASAILLPGLCGALVDFFVDQLRAPTLTEALDIALSEPPKTHAQQTNASYGGLAQLEPWRLVPASVLPLRASGRWLRDRHGRRVRLRCVNWYGAHMAARVVGGLHLQPLKSLTRRIRDLGFNCVRLPYSLDLQLQLHAPPEEWLRMNPDLVGKSGLEVLDATVAALAAEKILVILNNHQGRAMWCCSEDDGEGLWYTPDYPEEVWLAALGNLSERYRGQPYVLGYDLRNELRGVPAPPGQRSLRNAGKRWPGWGEGPAELDWAAAAQRGALAVVRRDPNAMVIVEGLSFSTDLSGLRRTEARPHRHPELLNRVIYEAHDYCWFYPNLQLAEALHCLAFGWALWLAWILWLWRRRPSSKQQPHPKWSALALKAGCADDPSGRRFRLGPLAVAVAATTFWGLSTWLASYQHYEGQVFEKWGFLVDEGEAPVWLGEFGTNGPRVTTDWWMEVGEVTWWANIIRYIRERDLDFSYWALNGNKEGGDETFGIFEQDWKTLRHPWILNDIMETSHLQAAHP